MKKKALITSIMTIVLCLSIIAGSTFALFTSTSSVNIVVTAGKVNVVASIDQDSLSLYSPKAIDMDGNIVDDQNAATTTFANGGTATLSGNTLTLENVTPGDKAEFTINIENNSNVNILYRTLISCNAEGAELLGGLDISIGTKKVVGKSDWAKLDAGETISDIACSVTLPADAETKYQGKECTLTFTVEAVQGNADTTVNVSDLTSLRDAIANGENVRLTSDITLTSDECYKINDTYGYCLILAKKSADIDLNGHTISYTRDTDGGDVASRFGLVVAGGATVNIYDSSNDQNGGIAMDNDDDNDDSWGMVLYAENGSTLNVYGGNFTSSHSEVVYSQGKAPNYAPATINLYGGKYSTTCSYSTSLLNIQNGCASRIYIYGGSFEGFQPGVTNAGEAILAEGYKVVQDGDWYNVVEDSDVVVSINTKEDLFTFANDVITNGNTYADKIVRLKSDIDLAGETWTPIMNADLYHNFSGIFDGNGYTIKNMTVNASEYAGFFGKTIDATIKNVTFENANVSGNHYAGVVVAWVTDGCPNVKIENCNVKNSRVTLAAEQIGENWDNGDKAGAIVGFVGGGSISGGIKNCTVSNTTVQGYRDIGGIVGYAGTNVIGCTIEEVTIIVDKTHNYKDYTSDDAYDAGSFGGEFVSGYEADENCSGTADIQY